jgi:hypothetical protein
VPPFYAIVELTGPRYPAGRCNPATRLRDLPGIRHENILGRGIIETRGSLSDLQNSRTDSALTYLELHKVNHLPKVVHWQ